MALRWSAKILVLKGYKHGAPPEHFAAKLTMEIFRTKANPGIKCCRSRIPELSIPFMNRMMSVRERECAEKTCSASNALQRKQPRQMGEERVSRYLAPPPDTV